ncbi:MAG: hypothetical protein AB7T06_44225 [Kofleriaceae bacterium]
MGEHEQGGHHGFHGSPVVTGLSLVDYMHLVGEGAVSGGLSAGTAGAHLAAEAGEIFEGVGHATAAQRAMFGATAIASPIAVGGGVLEIVDGINGMVHGDAGKGLRTTVTGAATAGSGVAGIAGLAGSAGGATLAPVLSSFAAGAKLGAYGDEEVRRMGWLQDRDGNDASASEWAAEKGQAVDEWVTEHTFGPLGTLAGFATTYGASLLGAGASVAAAAVGDRGMEDIMAIQQGHTSGNPVDAFHQGIVNSSGDPLAAFHHGITRRSGG